MLCARALRKANVTGGKVTVAAATVDRWQVAGDRWRKKIPNLAAMLNQPHIVGVQVEGGYHDANR